MSLSYKCRGFSCHIDLRKVLHYYNCALKIQETIQKAPTSKITLFMCGCGKLRALEELVPLAKEIQNQRKQFRASYIAILLQCVFLGNVRNKDKLKAHYNIGIQILGMKTQYGDENTGHCVYLLQKDGEGRFFIFRNHEQLSLHCQTKISPRHCPELNWRWFCLLFRSSNTFRHWLLWACSCQKTRQHAVMYLSRPSL